MIKLVLIIVMAIVDRESDVVPVPLLLFCVCGFLKDYFTYFVFVHYRI